MTTSLLSEQTAAAPRQAMVASQLRTTGVSDQRVVAAMATTPRETYLPGASESLAYRDTLVLLGGGRAANPPIATGRLLTAAMLERDDRALLIGAAGGYTAAILAAIVAEVTAVESDAALAAHARAALATEPRVKLVEGPLAEGAPANAPYSVLIVDGAIEALPEALIAQVAIGGRVVAGLIDRGVTRLASGRRTAGGFALQPFADSECALLPGFAAPARFRF